MRNVLGLFGLLAVALLSGCGAMHTAVTKRDLLVQTRLSAPVQVERPAPAADDAARSIFLDFINDAEASDEREQLLALRDLLHKRGYVVVDRPEAARYNATISVRGLVRERPGVAVSDWAEDLSDDEIDALLKGPLLGESWSESHYLRPRHDDYAGEHRGVGHGHGHVSFGVQANVHIGGHISGRDAEKLIFAALIITAAEVAGNALVKDVYYSMLTDIDISERLPLASQNSAAEQPGQAAANAVNSESKTGEPVGSELEPEQRDYHLHILSFANQVNLSAARAKQVFNEELLRALAEVF